MAKKWLDEHGLSYKEVHIVESTPSKEDIKKLYLSSGLDLMKFFNTTGVKYRELGLKDKLKNTSDEEKVKILASDGMLIKRPIVTDGEKVTIGFKEEDFAKTWL